MELAIHDVLPAAKEGKWLVLATARNRHSIETRSGIFFCLTDPNPSHIKIEDIAHSLSMQCRFNGHCNKFYSVAEHCVQCVMYAQKLHLKFGHSARMLLFILLHDAAEAYTGDIITPVKTLFDSTSVFLRVEADLESCIYEVLVGGQPAPDVCEKIHQVDKMMLVTEFSLLKLHPEYCLEAVSCEPSPVVELFCWAPEQAKEKFLRYFRRFTKEMTDERKTSLRD